MSKVMDGLGGGSNGTPGDPRDGWPLEAVLCCREGEQRARERGSQSAEGQTLQRVRFKRAAEADLPGWLYRYLDWPGLWRRWRADPEGEYAEFTLPGACPVRVRYGWGEGPFGWVRMQWPGTGGRMWLVAARDTAGGEALAPAPTLGEALALAVRLSEYPPDPVPGDEPDPCDGDGRELLRLVGRVAVRAVGRARFRPAA